MRTLVRVLAVLAAGGAAFFLLRTLLDNDERDANIGAGLLMFGLLAVGVAAWAFVDGLRAEGYVRALIPWVVVALAVGIALPVAVATTEGLDRDTLVQDLAGTIPFMIVLVLVPAALAVAVGRARGVTRPPGKGTRASR
jgi:drug/metabolite transporter (DMT)-like permease